MELFDRLAAVARDWDVLRHPFYTRWSDGDLTRDDLALYAREYRRLVVALAETARLAAEDDHADAEAAHIALWDAFADAAGSTPGGPLPETEECVAAWSPEDALAALGVLYAVEAAQPEISRVKLAGLREHYGFGDGPATEYFAVHAELDADHAARSRARLETEAGEADAAQVVRAAEAALRGNWTMLDGVERALAGKT